jgi:hypothetical protein
VAEFNVKDKKVKVKFALEQAVEVQRGSVGIIDLRA